MTDGGPHYSLAMVEFLDRETGSIKRSLCYPITLIVFYDLNVGAPPKPQAAYTVNDEGRWVPTPIPSDIDGPAR